MVDSPSHADAQIVDIRELDEWRELPTVTFDQMASLHIAKWVLWIFGGVYLLSFGLAILSFLKDGATFDKCLELVKFMVGSILPLVTLAVGYYLGDKTTST